MRPTLDLAGTTDLMVSIGDAKSSFTLRDVSGEIKITTRVSVSLSRMPYTDEIEGGLLVRLSENAWFSFGTLRARAILMTISSSGPIHQRVRLSEATALKRGEVVRLGFDLTCLPTAKYADNMTLQVEILDARSGVVLARPAPLPFVRLGEINPSSMTVLDYETGAVLIGTQRLPLLPNGFDSHFSSSGSYDNNYAFRLARRGFNTVIVGVCLEYAWNPGCISETMTLLDSFGRFGLLTVLSSQYTMLSKSRELPPGFVDFITAVKDHPALLGYYLFDDCCGDVSPGGLVYAKLKLLDPYHVTMSPLISIGDAWRYQVDSGRWRSGSPATDIFFNEHYYYTPTTEAVEGALLGAVATAGLLTQFPMDFVPNWQMGMTSDQRDGFLPPMSARDVAVQDWVAFIGGSVRGQLWFTLSWSLNQRIIEAAADVGRAMSRLHGAILSKSPAPHVHTEPQSKTLYTRAWHSATHRDCAIYIGVVNPNVEPLRDIAVTIVGLAKTTQLNATVLFEAGRCKLLLFSPHAPVFSLKNTLFSPHALTDHITITFVAVFS
jgi:hypothetical protein